MIWVVDHGSHTWGVRSLTQLLEYFEPLTAIARGSCKDCSVGIWQRIRQVFGMRTELSVSMWRALSQACRTSASAATSSRTFWCMSTHRWLTGPHFSHYADPTHWPHTLLHCLYLPLWPTVTHAHQSPARGRHACTCYNNRLFEIRANPSNNNFQIGLWSVS